MAEMILRLPRGIAAVVDPRDVRDPEPGSGAARSQSARMVVHLDQVVLLITAESAPGALLGNLLCAIVGLLDGGGAVEQVITLLNRLLGVLG
jgi:hypothetical protein